MILSFVVMLQNRSLSISSFLNNYWDRLSTNTFLKKKGWKSLIYWGFRHREQSVLGVMGALFLCLRELVKEQWRGYDYTISENESTILLFWAKRENDFTIWGWSRLWVYWWREKKRRQRSDAFNAMLNGIKNICGNILTDIKWSGSVIQAKGGCGRWALCWRNLVFATSFNISDI